MTKTEDGFLAVSYSSLISPLLAAVKKLYVDITSLNDEVSANQERLKRLEVVNLEMKRRNEALEAENAMIRSYLCQKDTNAPFCTNN